eukprot:TRINITY_DN9276_c0_g1_i1.p1 TRINITY_DN9276_c0_g1~~TRINITY_DN9276_c0_g1_i1.p1  ORF type:complete len:375 (+),score=66.16 TRINITY_DN9276_c0_g1_i1:43-1167(+)
MVSWSRRNILFLYLQVIYIATGEKCEVGKRQSPIDIETNSVRYQEFRPFKLSGHHLLSLRDGTMYAENTGDTIKLKAKSKHTKATIEGGPLNVEYEFVEMHFHWGNVSSESSRGVSGSEHKIDGKSYPLELHMVHRNVHDETVAEAVEHENGITVLGFKFQMIEDDGVTIPAMDTLMQIMDKYLSAPQSSFTSKDFTNDITGDVNVFNFLPVLMDEYFHYHGSLTTGGCQEAVNWMVFKVPLAVKEKHLMALQMMQNKQGQKIVNNFRETQPVNERPVYYHGIELIQKDIITRGSSVGLRSTALPKHEDFTLTYPCKEKASKIPNHAVMADPEERKSASALWSSSTCGSCFIKSNLLIISLAVIVLAFLNQQKE